MPSCCFCLSSFRSVNGLYHHFRRHHPLQVSRVLKCLEEGCLHLKRDWKQLRRHLIRDHKYCIRRNSTLCKRSIVSNANECNLRNSVTLHAATFVSKLYGIQSLPHSQVQTVVEGVQVLLRDIAALIPPNLVTQRDADSKDGDQLVVQSLLEAVVQPFNDTLSNEQHRSNFYLEARNYFEPVDYLFDYGKDKGLNQWRPGGKYIPIQETLSRLISMPCVFSQIKLNHADLEVEFGKGCITNHFMHGQLWRRKLNSFKGKFVLPIFLYIDHLTVGSQGSVNGTQKLGAVYYTLPSLTLQHQPSLENVFLALVFHVSERCMERDDGEHAFRKLIAELNALQTDGVTVEVNNKRETVYFCVGLIFGNGRTFNNDEHLLLWAPDYTCRFCQVDSDNFKVMKEERKASEYDYDWEDGLNLFGVAEMSPWNDISNFHVYENYAVNYVHDLLQDVCRTDMAIVLRHFVCDEGLLSVATLNARVNSFNYKLHGLVKPPCFLWEDIQDMNMRFTATEMLHFVILFSLFVGEMLEEIYEDSEWQLYLLLREMLEIATSTYLTTEIIERFQELVEKHHKLRVEDINIPLKLSDHSLLHYPKVMEMSGPVSHLGTAHFESKHMALTSFVRDTSPSDIPYSLCKKEQISFCHRLTSNEGLQDRPEYDDFDFYSTLSNLNGYSEFSSSLPQHFKQSCILVPWIRFRGITYRINSVVVVNYDVLDLPAFGRIVRIILNETEQICFVCKIFRTDEFDENLYAYKVEDTRVFKCYEIDCLYYPFLAIHYVLQTNFEYVVLKHKL